MDHLGSDPYVIGDCLGTCDAACDLGYSKAPAEKCRNREAMGGRRARRLVMSGADIFFEIRYLSTVFACCMAIRVGSTIGSYQITARIGSGGMGDVYRARDGKLKREVAIKSLPDSFARDPKRIGRFQQEAEVLASLNHPNIAAIYDLLEAEGSMYLVLELVEGETLADRLKRGPMTVEEALHLSLQIAAGLEAAHELGIVHRDLKPANIKISDRGTVKLLDFGIAKR